MKALVVAAAFAACCALPVFAAEPASPSWSMNATAIEACSCPMFCQCYFNMEPAGHMAMAGMDNAEHMEHMGHGEGGHFCRFNNAYRINKGSYGATKL